MSAQVSTLGQDSPTTPSSRAFLAHSPIKKVLVANRGEIACRVMATARRLGLRTVAVYSEADRASQHVQMADEAYCIGGAAARDSYLRGDAVLHAARTAGAHAIHPGYGFLSENAAFADACAQAGVVFVGPPGAAIRAMGDKAQAKAVMSSAGVPVVPGYHGDDQADESLVQRAKDIGFPLLVKAVSGGGGKGMKLAHNMQELPAAIASARREAAASFGDDRLLLERYVTRPRHVEVQVVADSQGNAVYLYDRDCSVQRRHQKIIEEAPAPFLSGEFHAMIGEAAVKAAQAVGYRSAGTVEFIVDVDSPNSSSFYFMEMNTRLQVEHPVSEAVSGVDLVEWQLVVAAGGKLPLTQQEVFHGEQVGGAGPYGHSFEARLYAESPRNNFLPGAGTVRRWCPPAGAYMFGQPFLAPGNTTLPSSTSSSSPSTKASGGAAAAIAADVLPPHTYLRVDSGVREGDQVGTNYDPMIAKLITWGPDRNAALAALRYALSHTQVAGLPTNLEYLRRLAAHPAFIAGELDTGFVKRHADALLAPHVVTPVAAAVAGSARHLLEVADMAGVRPAGAWGIPDSKRLWHHKHLKYSLSVPDAAPEAHTTAPAAPGVGHASTGSKQEDGLQVAVTVKSATDFDVHVAGVPDATGSASGGHTGHSGQRVHVRGAALVDGRLQAEVDHRRVIADVARYSTASEQVLCVWLDGEQFEFRWPLRTWSKDVHSVEQHAHGAHSDVKAPMPGRVVKVLVADGDKVSQGAPLVLIEAMKMEHPVVAPRAGVVKGLAVAQGVQVQDGQVLLVVEAEESAVGTGSEKAAQAA